MCHLFRDPTEVLSLVFLRRTGLAALATPWRAPHEKKLVRGHMFDLTEETARFWICSQNQRAHYTHRVSLGPMLDRVMSTHLPCHTSKSICSYHIVTDPTDVVQVVQALQSTDISSDCGCHSSDSQVEDNRMQGRQSGIMTPCSSAVRICKLSSICYRATAL